MEYKEIIEKLKELEYTSEDLGIKCLPKFIEGIGAVEMVDSYGGSDMGSTYYSVYYFVEHDVYIKTDGYYSSYEGAEFEDFKSDCTQVIPKQVTVTQYQKI